MATAFVKYQAALKMIYICDFLGVSFATTNTMASIIYLVNDIFRLLQL